MSGRGCTITVKVLDSVSSDRSGQYDTDDLSLPVALHSPLEVLKNQLTEIVGIPIQDQVLILCNLSDPDRNSDVLLSGRDFMTLKACGIKNGSVLTLHALGLSAELKQKLLKDALAKKVEIQNYNNKPIHSLPTLITAAEADHSYNGIIFDVQSTGPYEVDLLSVSIGGMLGRIRVYARDRPWHADNITPTTSQWWAHRESLSREGWELIADKYYRPSWDRHVEIRFNKPVRLLPHTRRALYCHSDLPDDLGIQYQSYNNKEQIVAQSEYIIIFPGLGHTGSLPFDDTHGWYRSYRSLAVCISYTVQHKGWSPFEHHIFPSALQQSVITMLLCQNTTSFSNFIQRCNSNDNGSIIMNLSRKKNKNEYENYFPSKKAMTYNDNNFNDNGYNAKSNVDYRSNSNIIRDDSLHISNLPVFVIYYIMEFMVSYKNACTCMPKCIFIF